MTAAIECSIQVQVPARVAYDQWTQFGTFPVVFGELVQEVEQIDERTVRWRASLGGAEREWVAEITEQIPDERIAWRSVSGPTHAGVVAFHRLSSTSSKVVLQMEYEPENVLERMAHALGQTERLVLDCLDRFKRFLESRGEETGAGRGTTLSKDDVQR